MEICFKVEDRENKVKTDNFIRFRVTYWPPFMAFPMVSFGDTEEEAIKDMVSSLDRMTKEQGIRLITLPFSQVV